MASNTFIQLPANLQDNQVLRRFLEKLVEQLDIAFGNRGEGAFISTTGNVVAQLNITLQELSSEIKAKEPAFTKGTAFNKNFGSSVEEVARGNHNHDGTYSLVGHNHDGTYSVVGHNHDGTYSLVGHNHNGEYTNNTMQAAISNINLTASATYDSTELQAVADKVDSILLALRGASIIN